MTQADKTAAIYDDTVVRQFTLAAILWGVGRLIGFDRIVGGR